MASPLRADRYERMVKLYKIWVKVWLRLLATCSSSGWTLRFENIFHAVLQFFLAFIFVATVISIGRLLSYRLKTQLSLYPIGALLVGVTIFRIRWRQRRLIAFFHNAFRGDRSTLCQNCFLRTMLDFQRTSSIIVPIMFLHYANVILVPFLKTAMRQDFEQIDVMCMPYFLTCRRMNVSRVFSNLCWDVESYAQNAVKNVSLTVVFTCMILPFSASLTFFSFVIIFVKTNVLVVREELSIVAEYIRRGGQYRARRLSTREASMVRERLSNVVRYYRRIYR